MVTEPAELKPAYLIRGTDSAKIDAALAALRVRAEREAGPGALQSLAGDGSTPPDPAPLLAELPAMSLIAERRYLIAEGVERWSAAQAKPVLEALGALPPETTVVLVGRQSASWDSKTKAKVKKLLESLAKAVEGAGGGVLTYEAPNESGLPSYLMREATKRGFELESEAARALVARMGFSTQRLGGELDRLALFAGDGGTVTGEQLAAMVTDTTEEVAWTFSDAIVDRDAGLALAAAERLAAQGDSVTALVYQAAKRLREARLAVQGLAEGHSSRELEASLPMHPYAAKLLIQRVRGADPGALREASCAVADLEWWTRGGSDYPEDVALTLAVRRATGA